MAIKVLYNAIGIILNNLNLTKRQNASVSNSKILKIKQYFKTIHNSNKLLRMIGKCWCKRTSPILLFLQFFSDFCHLILYFYLIVCDLHVQIISSLRRNVFWVRLKLHMLFFTKCYL